MQGGATDQILPGKSHQAIANAVAVNGVSNQREAMAFGPGQRRRDLWDQFASSMETRKVDARTVDTFMLRPVARSGGESVPLHEKERTATPGNPPSP